MAYPNYPYQPPYSGMSQASAMGQAPVNGVIPVTGEAGASAYPIPPNSSMVLFDSNADIMYIKTTDAGGYPTIRKFSFTPIEDNPLAAGNFVSRDEFVAKMDEIKELIANGQQPVSAEQPAKSTK